MSIFVYMDFFIINYSIKKNNQTKIFYRTFYVHNDDHIYVLFNKPTMVQGI